MRTGPRPSRAPPGSVHGSTVAPSSASDASTKKREWSGRGSRKLHELADTAAASSSDAVADFISLPFDIPPAQEQARVALQLVGEGRQVARRATELQQRVAQLQDERRVGIEHDLDRLQRAP